MTSSVPGALAGDFRAAMRRLASTVCILTTRAGGQRRGMTATAVMSLSVDPPSLAVSINRSASINGLLQAGEAFAVNLLAEAHDPLAMRFAGGAPPDARFDGLDWKDDNWGAPHLPEAAASLACVVEARFEHATHTLVVGGVREVRLSGRTSPLLFANGAFTGLRQAPPALGA